MDKFLYPVYLDRSTDILFDNGVVQFTITVPRGRYYNCTTQVSDGYTSFMEKIKDLIEAQVSGTVFFQWASPVLGGARSGILISGNAMPAFTLRATGADPYLKGLAMLGIDATKILYSSNASPLSALGIWVPPVETSDSRIKVSREAFKTEGYYNAWAPVERRRFLYKAVHPAHVFYSPYREPEDSLATWGGLPLGDVNNTWQSVWESTADGDDIIVIYGGATAVNTDYWNYSYDIGRLKSSNNLRASVQAFGVPERYTISFEVLLG